MRLFPLAFATTPLQTTPETRDKDQDLLLYYPEDVIDSDGVVTTAPPPKGLSGCGIWRICRAPVLPVHTMAEDMRLVGIQHRWRPKSRYLVGSSVHHVREMLLAQYPGLSTAINLTR